MLRQGLSIMHAGAEGKEKVRDPQSETVHNESVPSPFLLPEGRDHITRNLQGAPFRRPPCLVVGNAGAHLRVRILRSSHVKHSASRLRGHAGLPTAGPSGDQYQVFLSLSTYASVPRVYPLVLRGRKEEAKVTPCCFQRSVKARPHYHPGPFSRRAQRLTWQRQVSWLPVQTPLPTPSQSDDQWTQGRDSPVTVAGPRRTYTGFPVRPEENPKATPLPTATLTASRISDAPGLRKLTLRRTTQDGVQYTPYGILCVSGPELAFASPGPGGYGTEKNRKDVYHGHARVFSRKPQGIRRLQGLHHRDRPTRAGRR